MILVLIPAATLLLRPAHPDQVVLGTAVALRLVSGEGCLSVYGIWSQVAGSVIGGYKIINNVNRVVKQGKEPLNKARESEQ